MLAAILAAGFFIGKAGTVSAGRSLYNLLPGDTAISAAAFNQNTPEIARSDNGYLVVWEDSRTNYINIIDGFQPEAGQESGQLLKDIYAIRLDANGQPLDQTPIVVSQDIWSQTRPQVAWNGESWLVVWNTERLAGTTTTIDVAAARVSSSGVVLDSPAIVIDSDPTIPELAPVVASDGTNWVVTWQDGYDDGRLNATRVSPSGNLLDGSGVSVVIANFPDQPVNPAITFAGDEYLFVWQGNNKIRGLRVSTTLQPIGSVFEISASGNFPRVATDGTDFLVSWKRAASVYAGRVTHAGAVLDGSGFDVSASHGGDPRPHVAWDGSQWFITWVATNGTVYAARVAANGSLTDPGGLAVAESGRVSAIAAQSGGGVRVVWGSYLLNGLGSTDVFGGSMSASGVPGQAAAVSLSAPQQLRPDITPNGTGYMAVFLSIVSGETRVKAQRLDSAGNAIDAEPILVMGGSQTLTRPRVAWNGSVYLVVWEDTSVSRGFVPGAIFGKRVSAAGQVLDASPVEIMGGNTPDVAALGSTFLVVDTFEQTDHIRFPMAVRVDTNGAVVGTPASIGGNYAQLPKVTALGSRWLAVWQRSPTHDNPATFVHAAFVNPDGTSEASFLVAGVDGGRYAEVPDVAAGPNQALISYILDGPDYAINSDIYARRILADGTLLDNDPGINVASADLAQKLPSSAWTGSEYVVAYEDYRNVTFLDRPVSDLYATRVDTNGTVLDPNGFVVSNESIPEVNAAVASNPGSYLIGFAHFKPAQPYGAYRIDILHGDAGTPPTPSTPASTSTPVATSTSTLPPATQTSTSTSTATATRTSTAAITGTPVSTATTGATNTPVNATNTPEPTSTQQAPTATPTLAACVISYNDVEVGSTFYTYVQCLSCRGIVNGYPDGTFRPGNPITRGQLAKIVSNAANYNDPITKRSFEDVPVGSTFYEYVEKLALHGVVGGYECGSPGEPCGPESLPYYRPSAGVTRGQTAKIVAMAANVAGPPIGSQGFADVPPTQTFYTWIEGLRLTGAIGGYACGGPGEPCDSENRPYFRSGAGLTRGQGTKIVSTVFFPNCQP